MRILYNSIISPPCRKVRIVLGEKKLLFQLVGEEEWKGKKFFSELNPMEESPVLVEEDGSAFCDGAVIGEYLDETYPDPMLLIGEEPVIRAEVRRLASWFDYKFYRDVTIGLVDEKLLKRGSGAKEPDSRLIREAYGSIRYHLEYISWLTEHRTWLAGRDFSMADIAAAAQLSCIDYGGAVPWDAYPYAKDWYVRIKSRPSFRQLLNDYLPGTSPSPHYANLDF